MSPGSSTINTTNSGVKVAYFLRSSSPVDGAHSRTLQKALVVLGTRERLAIALDVPAAELDRYMNGEPLPDKLFLEALDIVARGVPKPK